MPQLVDAVLRLSEPRDPQLQESLGRLARAHTLDAPLDQFRHLR